jgi:hypothetical protein
LFVSFEAPKVTKSAFQQQGFFSHVAFALQISQNPGLQNVALLRLAAGGRVRSNPLLPQLLLCPFRRSWPPLFWLILPEAVLLI